MIVAARIALAAVAVVLLLWQPVAPLAARTDAPAGAAVGLGAAGFSFALLAGFRRPPPLRGTVVARAVTLAMPSVAATALVEEVIWRYGVLGVLRIALGTAVAAWASTFGFAAVHAPHGGRAARAALVTGAAFAAVYLITGRLVAAVLAHAVYNLLVVAASATTSAEPQPAATPP